MAVLRVHPKRSLLAAGESAGYSLVATLVLMLWLDGWHGDGWNVPDLSQGYPLAALVAVVSWRSRRALDISWRKAVVRGLWSAAITYATWLTLEFRLG